MKRKNIPINTIRIIGLDSFTLGALMILKLLNANFEFMGSLMLILISSLITGIIALKDW